MPGSNFLIGGILATVSLVGAAMFMADRSSAIQLKQMELTANSIRVDAWDKLSTRAILKSADTDLKTYFLKEQEHAMIVRDFYAAKEELKESSMENTVALQQVLYRLHGSPFFNKDYMPEYNALWAMLSTKKNEVKCKDLIKAYPDQNFEDVFDQCRFRDASVKIKDAADRLGWKLQN